MSLLWDVHVLHGLERWRQQSGDRAADWFIAAGEWEALAALSVLSHDNPDWTFPVMDEQNCAITASKLTHPLIHPAIAVANDVTVVRRAPSSLSRVPTCPARAPCSARLA
jgi:hypothetical protein